VNFAGYFLDQPFTSLSASWSIPTVLDASYNSGASTWIGAEDNQGHFIQVGVLENTLLGETYDQAFWTDSSLNYHPEEIFNAAAGDRIVASMTQTAAGWKYAIRDLTIGEKAVGQTDYAPSSTFTEAQWLQEDPIYPDRTPPEFPYPKTTNVVFSHLSINGGAPELVYSDAGVMSTPNSIVLLPTKVRNDGFVVQPAGPLQSRYVQDVRSFEVAVEQLNFLVSENARTSLQTSAGTSLLNAIGGFDAALAPSNWPPRLRGAVQRLRDHNELDAAALLAWLRASPNAKAAVFARLVANLMGDQHSSRALAVALGLP
jgi:hypothetical protein